MEVSSSPSGNPLEETEKYKALDEGPWGKEEQLGLERFLRSDISSKPREDRENGFLFHSTQRDMSC
jgi:hypothetical protein